MANIQKKHGSTPVNSEAAPALSAPTPRRYIVAALGALLLLALLVAAGSMWVILHAK